MRPWLLRTDACCWRLRPKDASEPEYYSVGFEMNPTMGSVQLWEVTTGVNPTPYFANTT